MTDLFVASLRSLLFRLGKETVYLNTADKQAFYEHIGYTLCEPVTSGSFGAKIKVEQFKCLNACLLHVFNEQPYSHLFCNHVDYRCRSGRCTKAGVAQKGLVIIFLSSDFFLILILLFDTCCTIMNKFTTSLAQKPQRGR